MSAIPHVAAIDPGSELCVCGLTYAAHEIRNGFCPLLLDRRYQPARPPVDDVPGPQTAADNSADPRPVWMVAGISMARGQETPTFGPFGSEQLANEFAALQDGHLVYDDAVNRASLCGPWRP
jgi:hypothetical protein